MRPDGELHLPFTWVGMVWEMLIRKTSSRYFGIYVGYTRENVRQGFSMRLKGTFSLVDADEKELVPPEKKGRSLLNILSLSLSLLLSLLAL